MKSLTMAIAPTTHFIWSEPPAKPTHHHMKYTSGVRQSKSVPLISRAFLKMCRETGVPRRLNGRARETEVMYGYSLQVQYRLL